MNIKQTAQPLVTGVIATALCFSLGFFESVFKYNGFQFFYAYIAFTLLLCYPMNIIAIYLEKVHPEINTHSKLIKKLTGSSKLKPLSVLLTGSMVVILSIVIFSITSYFLDFVDNVPAIDKLSSASLSFGSSFPMYISLVVILVIMVLMLVLISKKVININNLIVIISHNALYLILILAIITFTYLPHSSVGIDDFLFGLSYQTNTQIHNMMAMAMIYAILSNFVSLALYKNILGVVDNDANIKLAAFKSVFYNIVISIIFCIVIYAVLGNYRPYHEPVENIHISSIFIVIKVSTPIYYLMLEAIFITFNIIVFVAAIKYICDITRKLHLEFLIFLIPFIITTCFICRGYTNIYFSMMFGFHLVIIYLFLFDIFMVGWVYDAQKFSYEILKNTGTKLSPIFNVTLRIFTPLICLFVTIGYIVPTISLLIQLLIAFGCTVIYIIKGSIFNNIFNKRKF